MHIFGSCASLLQPSGQQATHSFKYICTMHPPTYPLSHPPIPMVTGSTDQSRPGRSALAGVRYLEGLAVNFRPTFRPICDPANGELGSFFGGFVPTLRSARVLAFPCSPPSLQRLVLGAFSSCARILGECSTIHSRLRFFFFLSGH